MRRTHVLGMVLLFLCLTISSGTLTPKLPKQDQKKSDAKALQMLEKSIAAMGGRKVMENVKDTTVSGSLSFTSFGMEGAITLYTKRDNMLRMDIEMMGMLITQAFDGEDAWMINPQTASVEDMPEEAADYFRKDAIGDGALLYPEKFGITYTYKGSEKIEDKDYQVLVQTFPDGYEITFYLDAETYLPYKTISIAPNPVGGGEGEAETFMTDYRKIDGLMVAHTVTQYMDGEEFMVVTVDEVKYNTGLEDAFFKRE